MDKKKSNKVNEKADQLNESPAPYRENSKIIIFHSFEEQENYHRVQMARLTPLERMQHLRKMIDLAYGMHGFDPNNLPCEHKITIR